MVLQVFTGNRVSDGIVVFMTADGDWTETVSESRLIASAEDEAAANEMAEKAADDAVVADPYLIDVTEDGGEIRPVRYRERIRAYGPPVHPDFVKTPPSDADHFSPGGKASRPSSDGA